MFKAAGKVPFFDNALDNIFQSCAHNSCVAVALTENKDNKNTTMNRIYTFRIGVYISLIKYHTLTAKQRTSATRSKVAVLFTSATRLSIVPLIGDTKKRVAQPLEGA